MRNKLIASTVLKRSPGSWLRLILWIFLLTGVVIVAVVVSGYIGASKPVSYLPDLCKDDIDPLADTIVSAEIKRSLYNVSVTNNGDVFIRTSGGEVIMSGLKYYSSYEGFGETWGLGSGSVEATSDSSISISGEGSAGTAVNMILTVSVNKPEIDVTINTRYNANTTVHRESLMASFDVAASDIFMKNRVTETASFDSEYWLNREGVRFGKGKRSALIYNARDVSSLQTDAGRRLLFINLEYRADHPFFNIPFQKDGAGKWYDLSDATYKTGDSRQNSFKINIGDIPGTVPRIMLVPKGYLAGYVFTEHADGGNIRTHRAAYFGSEDIKSISDATGGFAGYEIPVTKSIFFPDIDTTEDSSNEHVSEKAQTLDFMDQLNSTGHYDICLHGANSERSEVEEWIRFMKTRFDASTWIDHGMFSGIGNRQSFVCDGLNQASEYYTDDLWEKYNTEYFWNASVEELRKLPLKEKLFKLRFYETSLNLWRRYFSAEELHTMNFPSAFKELLRRFQEKGELNSFLPRRGNAFPTPLFWKHPTRSGAFYSWATDYVKTFSHSERGVKDEEKNLRKLVSDRGIFINHGYFVRNLYEDGVMINSDGKLQASPYFNQTLELMARMHEQGDLYLTTIKELLDYWVLTANITFDYQADGTILINNLNNKPINGFSLAIKGENVKIDGVTPNYRRSGYDTIVWFDLPAGQRVRMETE